MYLYFLKFQAAPAHKDIHAKVKVCCGLLFDIWGVLDTGLPKTF